MTTELYWLTLTTLMTALIWVPYVLDRFLVRGVWGTLANPKPDERPHSPWAQRAIRAHQNAVENLVIFAPAVLIASAMHLSTPATRLAVVVYFFARLAHLVALTAAVPVARTLAFLVGWGAQIVILVSILGWM